MMYSVICTRAAYALYNHMDQLKKSSNHTSSTEHVISQNDQDNTYQKFSRDPFSKRGRSYNLTKAAAIRM
ncbi:11301_t:CDS:2, partial [Racocetra fulgida]